MILDEIVEFKKKEIIELKKRYSPEPIEQIPSFKKALEKDEVALIAEIKYKSPSKNILRKESPEEIAMIYEKNGASAISVLVDQKYFGGNWENITRVKNVTNLPILCKEFIIDEFQIDLARFFGASAILLISEILTDEKIASLYYYAKSQGLEVLIELHSSSQIKKALISDIIGINNRDLYTFKTNINKTIDIIDNIPEDKIIVSESGISSRDDVEYLAKYGINAVLVGTSIMQGNIEKKVKELTGVKRK